MAVKVKRKHLEEALDLIIERVKARKEKRNGKPYASRHEMLGKVTEEYDELMLAVRKEKKADIKAETADVAEACIYAIASSIAKKEARKKRKKKAKTKEA